MEITAISHWPRSSVTVASLISEIGYLCDEEEDCRMEGSGTQHSDGPRWHSRKLLFAPGPGGPQGILIQRVPGNTKSGAYS